MKVNKKVKFIINRIKKRKSIITVIGLGYVGLPLCIALLKAKFHVFGIDNNSERVSSLKRAKSYISTIKDSQLEPSIQNKFFVPSTNFQNIEKSDVIIICVPTPIDRKKQPNMKYVKIVVSQIDKYLRKNQTVILECTSYPGTTEEFFIPILKRKKFQAGKNIFLGYSPEREDPGNKKFSIVKKNLSKVVSGYTSDCLNIVKEVYSTVSNRIYECPDIKTAEFTKLLENIYRSVNIGLVNELHQVCKKMNINIFDAINAAKTKPFGFKAFYPGPGVGGHCIPVDPYYLSFKAKQLGINTKFINLAGNINDNRPRDIANTIIKYIKKKKIKKNILILGITYKKNSDDIRVSPALKIFDLLNKKIKNKIFVCDPIISNYTLAILKKIRFVKLKRLEDKAFTKKFDLCFIGANHDVFNYKNIAKNFKIIFDSRNSFEDKKRKNIILV